MSDFLEVIRSRRTIRKFSPKSVEWDKISQVLEAGRHAPSAGNLQDWKFIVILEEELKMQLAEASLQQYFMVQAPILIVVCSEPEKIIRYYGARGEKLYSVQNNAACVQNMLLAANALGLGTCWIGAFDEDEVRRVLNIPADARPQAIICLGYPGESPKQPPKYPLETLVYFNSWKNKLRDPAAALQNYSDLLRKKAHGAAKQLKSFIDEKIRHKEPEEGP